MPQPTLADFRTEKRLGTDFATTPDAEVQDALDMAWETHKLNPRATMWLAAHYLAQDADNVDHGGARAVDLGSNTGVFHQDTQSGKNSSKMFQVRKGKEHEVEYLTTNYGQRYLELSLRAAMRRAVVFR